MDLFGNETPAPRASLRVLAEPVRIDLFACAAERLALESGRAVSQERAEVIAPQRLEEGVSNGK